MIQILPDLPSGITGVKAIGTVTREDYEQLVLPLIAEARQEGRRLRFLYQIGPEFNAFTLGAAWEDAKVGLHSMRLFDGCAIVTDLAWVREGARLAGFFMPCPVRLFGNHEVDKAIAWLGSLPEGPAVAHRLLAESGVLVIEVKQALRTQDFDVLEAAADTWGATHEGLQGLVIHAREFPGWENWESLSRHLRFIRDHIRRVERVALAVDGKLANWAPRVAEHFTQAEIKNFRYDDLYNATTWAAGSAHRTSGAPQA